MRKAVKIAFVAAAMVPALALAQGERRMLSLDERSPSPSRRTPR